MKGEFYKMEFDAWDEGTVDLTLEEEAAYLRLCHQMYRRRGPVPNSDRLLVSLWRCHQNKARPLLQRLVAAGKIFVTEDGDLSNTRVTQEVDARETLSTHRADAGHTGGIRSGHARRKTLKTKASTEAKRSREEKIREEENRGDNISEGKHPSGADTEVADPILGDQDFGSSSLKSLPPQEAIPPTSSPAPVELDSRARETQAAPPRHRGGVLAVEVQTAFETWWSAYPLKKSKGAAQRRYAEIIKAGRATEAQLLGGALRYAAERSSQDPRYTKHPSTWLNQDCWTDEPASRAQVQSSTLAGDIFNYLDGVDYERRDH